MRLPCLKLAASLVLALGSASAFAGIISVDTDTASATTAQANGTINIGGTRAVNILFNRETAAENVASVSGTLNYNTANFDVASNSGNCTVNDGAGTVPFITVDFAGIADNFVICTLTFTHVAGADGVVEPLTITGISPPATTVNNGQLTISAVPLNPTTINFAPTTVNLANGGNIAGQQSAPSIVGVTTGGAGTDPGSYSCTQPAGFTLTPNAAAGIPAGSDPADISVTCTLGGAAFQGTSTCTRTGGADVALTLNCPAGAGPVLSSTPPSGTTLNCNGTPGSTVTTSATISNTGTAQMTGVACNVVGAGFSIQTAPSPTVNAGASTSVVVACTPPAEGAPAATGTLSCTTTAPAGGALTFPLSSLGQTAVVPSQPETIPSTSLWAKIGLVGLLAALGMLLVGFRRQH